MINEIVVDVEIQNPIGGAGGLTWNDTDKLGIACAVVYEYRSDRFRAYGPKEVDILRESLLSADRITGFNTLHFDFPVIFGSRRDVWNKHELFPTLAQKSNDLLRRVWVGMEIDPDTPGPKGFGLCKLDQIATQTLGVGKIANGEIAPVWYQKGLIQKVINYCLDDVALERDLGAFMDKYRYVIIADGSKVSV